MAKQIEILDGYHLTQTEQKHLVLLFEMGLTNATNKKKNKSYEILQGWGNGEYKVRIGTYGTHTIGSNPKWNFNTLTIKVNN